MTDKISELKHQLQQLDKLRASGALSTDAAASARAELERKLVDAVLASPAPASATITGQSPPPRPSRSLVLGLATFVLVFGVAGYLWRGSSAGLDASPTAGPVGATAEAPEAAASAQHAMTMGQIEGMVGKLAERLKAQPDDAEGWLMLGRSYAVLSRFGEAIPAYRKVLTLQPKNAQAMADLADALAMSQNRSFAGEPTKLISAALAAEPDNLKALTLAGTLAFEGKDYTGALRLWERVVKVGQPDSDLVRQVQENIAEARQLAGLPPVAAGPGGTTPEPAGASPLAAAAATSVSGQVELAPALAAKASPDDTVFIFARPAEGSRMPLAILKKQVRDLPFSFTLDDSLAMSPAATLSKATSVVVGARVSKSGQAMPQPGDLQGLSAAVKPGASGLRIVIGEAVP